MSAEPAQASPLSWSTARSYATIWELFTDWCDVAGCTPLPADPAVVLEFLADCPAAVATQRRRVVAIDHHHATAGRPPPGPDPRVRAALGRPPAELPPIASEIRLRVAAALRMLPSRGWTGGLFGQRDRCLLVLSQFARIPHRQLARLTPGDVSITGGVATIAGRTWTVEAAADPVLCGPCAIARWLDTHRIIVTKIATRVVADHLDRADSLTIDSTHVHSPAVAFRAGGPEPAAGVTQTSGDRPRFRSARCPGWPCPGRRGICWTGSSLSTASCPYPRSRRGELGTSTARSGRCRLHEGTVADCVVSPSGRTGPPGRRRRRTRRCRPAGRRPGPANR